MNTRFTTGSAFDNEDFESTWNVTPYMRELWRSQKCN